MNRRNFISKSTGTAAVSLLPVSFWSSLWLQEFTIEELTGKANVSFYGKNYQLRKEVNKAFLKMQAKAKKEGIHIQIVSAYRSYERQTQIFNAKFNRYTKQGLSGKDAVNKIIEYSTIPGTSRHHWGTDIDIIDANAKQPKNVLMPKNYSEDGPYCDMKIWLNKHSEKFGFYIVYTDNPKRKGFYPEPWHFSYKKTSVAMLKAYQDIDFKKIITQDTNLRGREFLTESFLNTYKKEHILDINPALLP
ncbi:M15 family metallopeptidase [Mesonia ostreae]|uniref:M15 family metallopeptidase n=1 Tax=Mesonia ostreae TaxID=861110 RepID=A0ABU2KEV4_9FLAO|nr:M15 family metallopeptidase [Mesonia ostreae]MDT0293224.1 M15 family metallopeptidase [Mesonia ostreae]